MNERMYANFDKIKDHILVDFDGTLHDRSVSPTRELGPPVEIMVAKVKDWLAQGMQVKLFTARVALVPCLGLSDEQMMDYVAHQREILEAWCEKYIGAKLPITCEKTCYSYELWDDRAITVERNTGKVLGMNIEW